MKPSTFIKSILPLALLCTLSACQSSAEEKPNVLFIMVDDLRPVLGTYGFHDVQSPIPLLTSTYYLLPTIFYLLSSLTRLN